jgi:hypothetical protein
MSVDIMDCQCQACSHPGVEMFDICPECRWENDFSLEDQAGEFHEVGFVLTEAQSIMWSCANGDTPLWYRTMGSRNEAAG